MRLSSFFILLFSLPIVAGYEFVVTLYQDKNDSWGLIEHSYGDSCRDLGGISKEGITRIGASSSCVILYSDWGCKGKRLYKTPGARLTYDQKFRRVFAKSVPLSEDDGDSTVIGSVFMRLFDLKLTSFDFAKWPKVLKAYDELSVKADRLSFITPTFEVPILRLQPAVFPPNFRELPPPELEMFDLDEMFSSKEVRLTQLFHKCEDKDVEYFIREAGDACDVTSSLASVDRTARKILERMMYHLIEYKKNNIDDDDSMLADEHLFNVPTGNLNVADFSDLEDYDED